MTRQAIFLLIWCALAAVGGAVRARADSEADLARYFKALDCRQSEISLGPNRSGAIVFDTLDGNGVLTVIRIERVGPKMSPKVVASQLLRFQRSMDAPRLFWTRGDDLLIQQPGSVGFTNVRMLSTTVPLKLKRAPFGDFFPIFALDGDVVPSQIERSLLISGWGAERRILKFNAGDASVRPTDATLGDGGSFFVWNGGDLLGRHDVSPDGRATFALYSKKAKAWRELPMPTLPSGANIVLLRAFGRDRVEVAFFVRGFGATPDRILLWREGELAVRTLFSGDVARLAVSPSRTDIFGYFTMTGEFVSIVDRRRPPEIEFWLKQFARMDGLVDFGFLDGGRAAMVKSHDGAHAAKVAVLAQDNLNAVHELSTVCAGVDRGVREVAGDGRNYVFKPNSGNDKNLVVYLHGGPIGFVGRDGSWLSDVLTLNGHPVVVVNYTGSTWHDLARNDRRSFVDVFGDEVAAGVARAERELGTNYPHPIVVSNSFGSLVGLTAIASGRVQPSLFLGVGGVFAPAVVRPERPPSQDAPLERYLGQVASDLEGVVDPERVLWHAPGMRFVFVHGEDDATAPRVHVDQFVSRLNSLQPKHSARMWVVPGMFHAPDRKTNYDLVFRAVVDALVASASAHE